jgi:hypothetical protein
MSQEEKDLLLKDLCARLPYDVKVNCNDKVYNFAGIQYFNICILTDDNENNAFTTAGIKYIKPYLFPMSSMTEEQRKELYKIGWYLDEDKIYSCFRNYDDENYKTHTDCFELINWCYKNNFDINGLIPMGLALDATDKNIY